MRKKGSKFEYEEERDKDLMATYEQVMSTVKYASMEDVLRRVVSSPSKRFWVSEERATLIVKKMLKGRNPHLSFINKRTMFGEIYIRVAEYREKHPNVSIADAVWTVVRQPAPQFYITPGSAAVFLCNARRREKMRRNVIQRLFAMFKKDYDLERLEEYVERNRKHS